MLVIDADPWKLCGLPDRRLLPERGVVPETVKPRIGDGLEENSALSDKGVWFPLKLDFQLRLHPLASLLDRELGIIWIWLWLEGESESNLARMLLTALDLLELILLDLFELTLAFFAWRPTVAPPLLRLAVPA